MKNTPRKSITKVRDMTRKDLKFFLEDNEGYINMLLDCYKATVKIDGQAFRIFVTKDKIFYESSYSGLQEDCNFFTDERLKKAFSIIDKQVKTWLFKVREHIGYDFKLIGEVLCPLDNETFTFTPVVTTFSVAEVGKAKFIIHQIQDENGEILDNNRYNEVIDALCYGWWFEDEEYQNTKLVSSEIASHLFTGGYNYTDCCRCEEHAEEFIDTLVEYNELFSDFDKNWKAIRDIVDKKIQKNLRFNLMTPFAVDDAIQEGIVFEFNGKLFAVTLDEWREAHKKLVESSSKYNRGRNR